MNERQRVQAEPQVHVAFRGGREMRPTSKDRVAEYTTSLAQRELRDLYYAILRPQRRDCHYQVARSVAIPSTQHPGVTRTIADAPVRSPQATK